MRRGPDLQAEQRNGSAAAAVRCDLLLPRDRRFPHWTKLSGQIRQRDDATPVLHACPGGRDHPQGALHQTARDHQSLSDLFIKSVRLSLLTSLNLLLILKVNIIFLKEAF